MPSARGARALYDAFKTFGADDTAAVAVLTGVGERLVCRATVIKAGRMLITAEAKVFARDGAGGEKLIAVGLATIAVIPAERVGGRV